MRRSGFDPEISGKDEFIPREIIDLGDVTFFELDKDVAADPALPDLAKLAHAIALYRAMERSGRFVLCESIFDVLTQVGWSRGQAERARRACYEAELIEKVSSDEYIVQPLGPRRFWKLPMAVCFDHRFEPRHKIAWAVLAGCEYGIGRSKLARAIGKGESTARKFIAELESRRVLKRDSRDRVHLRHVLHLYDSICLTWNWDKWEAVKRVFDV